jgi:uncharacterized SAM-binding protein YcdF (DUF218 family)
MNLLNIFFPEQFYVVFFMFIAVFALGGLGLGLVRLAQPSFAVSAVAVVLLALVASYTCYTITIDLTVVKMAAIEAPTKAEDPRGQELVYVYGKDEPVTRAESERMLAYSAENSPGDAE